MRSERMLAAIEEYAPALAMLVALVATLGSLYYSEVAGFVPCVLCWYQRILMYPLVLIIFVGLVSRDAFLPRYVLPLSVMGMGVSTYHYLTQLGIVGGSNVCAAGVPCSLRYVNWLGFVTIPFQALIGFVLITALMLASRWAYNQLEQAA
ncbi:MAG TPA: disulfide oxidoreductase [Candidatus Sulfomarinibacteraceae bacterium]|nr:disulfide oxidoreductase [Candidatus Sulfomarinibacteraceae bacterium]